MIFDKNSAKLAGKKSKPGPAKKDEQSIKDKMEMLYEKVLDVLMINKDKLTKTIIDKFTVEQLKEKNEDLFY